MTPKQTAALEKRRAETFDAKYIEDVADEVYRVRLDDDSGKGAAARMIAKDRDEGQKLHRRSRSYIGIVTACLKVLRKRGELHELNK